MQLIYNITGEKAIGRAYFLFGSYEHSSGGPSPLPDKVFLSLMTKLPDTPSHPVRFKNLPLAEAAEAIVATGEPAFRARQVIKWVYQKRVDSFDGMKNVAKETRLRLMGRFSSKNSRSR